MHPMLNIAIRAARNAGDSIRRAEENINQMSLNQTNRLEFVHEINQVAEQEIIKVLTEAFPNHAIVTPINSNTQINDDYQWLVQALSGKNNIAHGFNFYAVSIALKHKGKLIVSVIYDAQRDELFTAERGSGAMLNNRKIRVSQQLNLKQALIATGAPFKTQQYLAPYAAMFQGLFTQEADIRRTGSTALDLAYLASGRVDGFWEIALPTVDIAAGILLLQEAGGAVTDFSFKETYLTSGNLIAGNMKIHQAMYKVIAPHVTDLLV